MEKRGLGRGLGALIPDKAGNQGQKVEDKDHILTPRVQAGISNIPIDKIKANKYQPREEFDQAALKDLAASIREKGVIQPVLVRDQNGIFELIAGERRFRAAQMIGLKEVPAIIKDVSDVDSLELSIIENVQRENLNPIDQANAFKRLIDEFDLTHESIAEAIGKDRVTVSNIMRLLKLPQKIRDCVSRGTITMGHARAILSLNSESGQMRLCTKIMKNGLSVRDTEKYAKNMATLSKATTAQKDPNIIELEETLRDMFGTKVKILKGKRGGRIEIEFYSDDDMARVVTLLKSNSYKREKTVS